MTALTEVVRRLEAERLAPAPREQDSLGELFRQLIAVLDAAIRADQAAGTWAARGR